MRNVLFFLICFSLAANAHAATYKIKEATAVNTLVTTRGQIIVLAGVAALPDEDLNAKGIQFLNGLVHGREVVVEGEGLVWYEVFDKSHLIDPADMDLPRFYYTQARRNKYKKEGTFVFLNATIIKSGFAAAVEIPSDPVNSKLFQELYDEFQAHNPPFCSEK